MIVAMGTRRNEWIINNDCFFFMHGLGVCLSYTIIINYEIKNPIYSK